MFDPELVGPWVAKRAEFQWHPNRGTVIGMSSRGKLIAGVVYEDWTGTNVTAHIAAERLLPGFVRAMFHYPFVQLKVGRITAPVCSMNEKAIRFVEKLGFRREATLEAAIPGGDLLFYRLWWHECRHLRGLNGKEGKHAEGA